MQPTSPKKRIAVLILQQLVGKLPRLKKIFSDGGCQGKGFAKSVKNEYHLDWEVVTPDLQSKGFKVLPRLGLVERTLAWLIRYRRLTIDYETLPATSEAFIYAAMVRLKVRRLA